jgi:hypothetical protein
MRRRRLEGTREVDPACAETRIGKSVVTEVAMEFILAQFIGYSSFSLQMTDVPFTKSAQNRIAFPIRNRCDLAHR